MIVGRANNNEVMVRQVNISCEKIFSKRSLWLLERLLAMEFGVIILVEFSLAVWTFFEHCPESSKFLCEVKTAWSFSLPDVYTNKTLGQTCITGKTTCNFKGIIFLVHLTISNQKPFDRQMIIQAYKRNSASTMEKKQ